MTSFRGPIRLRMAWETAPARATPLGLIVGQWLYVFANPRGRATAAREAPALVSVHPVPEAPEAALEWVLALGEGARAERLSQVWLIPTARTGLPGVVDRALVADWRRWARPELLAEAYPDRRWYPFTARGQGARPALAGLVTRRLVLDTLGSAPKWTPPVRLMGPPASASWRLSSLVLRRLCGDVPAVTGEAAARCLAVRIAWVLWLVQYELGVRVRSTPSAAGQDVMRMGHERAPGEPVPDMLPAWLADERTDGRPTGEALAAVDACLPVPLSLVREPAAREAAIREALGLTPGVPIPEEAQVTVYQYDRNLSYVSSADEVPWGQPEPVVAGPAAGPGAVFLPHVQGCYWIDADPPADWPPGRPGPFAIRALVPGVLGVHGLPGGVSGWRVTYPALPGAVRDHGVWWCQVQLALALGWDVRILGGWRWPRRTHLLRRWAEQVRSARAGCAAASSAPQEVRALAEGLIKVCGQAAIGALLRRPAMEVVTRAEALQRGHEPAELADQWPELDPETGEELDEVLVLAQTQPGDLCRPEWWAQIVSHAVWRVQDAMYTYAPDDTLGAHVDALYCLQPHPELAGAAGRKGGLRHTGTARVPVAWLLAAGDSGALATEIKRAPPAPARDSAAGMLGSVGSLTTKLTGERNGTGEDGLAPLRDPDVVTDFLAEEPDDGAQAPDADDGERGYDRQ